MVAGVLVCRFFGVELSTFLITGKTNNYDALGGVSVLSGLGMVLAGAFIGAWRYLP